MVIILLTVPSAISLCAVARTCDVTRWLLALARGCVCRARPRVDGENAPCMMRAQRHRHLRLRRHQVKARAVYVGLAP